MHNYILMGAAMVLQYAVRRRQEERRSLYHSSSEESDSSDDEYAEINQLCRRDPCKKREELLPNVNVVPMGPLLISSNPAQKRKIEDCQDVPSETKLHRAIKDKADSSAILAICTDEKSLIDMKNSEGKTALHMAVESSTTEVVKILLKAGANARSQDQNGFTPLHYAMILRMKMKGEAIIRHDGVNSLKSKQGWTVLHCAARSGHHAILKKLLVAITRMNRRRNRTKGSKGGKSDEDKDDQNLLDIQDNSGNTALHWTACHAYGYYNLKILLEAGANARIVDQRGYAPVHLAVLLQREKNAEVFFDHDNGYLPRDRYGMTPWHYPAQYGFVGITRLLLARAERIRDSIGRNLFNLQDKIRWTALHTAANRSSPEMVKILLTAGANSLQQDNHGYTPLHVTQSGIIAEILCDHDCGKCLRDSVGRTPLHYAVKYRRMEVVRSLLYCGVHPNVLDHKGKSPLFFSFSEEDDEVETLIQMIIASICLADIGMDWEDLGALQSDLEYCKEIMADCEAEILGMKNTKVPGSTISYHDLLKSRVTKAAVYLENGEVRKVLSGRDWSQSFPYYSDMISFRVRRAERRRLLNRQCQQCFTTLFGELPFLPKYPIDNILVFLNQLEMENFVDAFKCKA